MSRNGSGTYTLPAGNPVVTGTTITSSWANTTMQNIADGLTQSVASDGQTPMSGALNMATNKITALGTPAVSTDAATKAYVDLTQTASGITGGTITGATLTNDTIDSTPIGSTTPSTVKTTGLTVTGATSGTLAIAATAVAGTNTATFPASTGTVMVSGNMPAFSAYQSSAQTLSSGVVTKINFQTKEYDTANAFDATTNYRFQPSVAGYYVVNAAVQASAYFTTGNAQIYKNGSSYKVGFVTGGVSGTSGTFTVACQVFLNGSTDYIECYAVFNNGQAISAVSNTTYFQACLIRGA